MASLKYANYEYSSVFMNEMIDYLKLRRSKGYKERDNTKHILKSVDTFLCGIGLNEKEIKVAHVDDWLGTLPDSLCIATKSAYISGYTGFAKYLNSIKLSAFIPEHLKSGKEYIPYIFSQEEIEKIFKAADNMTVHNGLNKLTPLQFPILLRVLYGCGLRLGEALSLKVSDIDLNEGVIFVKNAKGNKDRLVPMDESLTRICRDYTVVMRDYFTADDALFFSNQNHKQYSISWPWKQFRKLLKQISVDLLALSPGRRNICLHCLRHTFAVNSFKKQDEAGSGGYSSAPLLSAYLGHMHLYHTEIYLRMTEEVHKSVIDKTGAYTKGIFPEMLSI